MECGRRCSKWCASIVKCIHQPPFICTYSFGVYTQSVTFLPNRQHQMRPKFYLINWYSGNRVTANENPFNQYTHTCMKTCLILILASSSSIWCVCVYKCVCTTRVGIMQFISILLSTHMPYAFARTHMYIILSQRAYGRWMDVDVHVHMHHVAFDHYVYTHTQTYIVHISAVSKKFHSCENVLQF